MKNTKTISPDFRIERSGGISLLIPFTAAAREWVDENLELESWQWIGGRIAVEPRCVEAIVDGMEEAGLIVAH